MITPLHDQREELEIMAAEFAVETAKKHHTRLHIAAAARIVRLAFPDAASLAVDVGLACGQPDSGEIELIAISDGTGRTLWTPESPLPAAGVSWPEVLNALMPHLVASFDEVGGFGWSEVIGGGLDVHSLELPPAQDDETQPSQQESP